MNEIEPKLSRVYREASSEQPSAALDAAILAAARRRVAKPQRRERSAWLRWMATASAIATLALGVSIALLVEHEQAVRSDETLTRPAPPQPQSPRPARAEASAKPEAADSAAPAVAEKKAVPAAASPRQAPLTAAPAPVPAAPTAPAKEAFPAESRAKAAESSMSAPGAATEANVARDTAAGGQAHAGAGKLAPLRQQAVQRSAEAWLEEISRLKREGREQEAAEQLAEFRKAYPAYAVPEALSK